MTVTEIQHELNASLDHIGIAVDNLDKAAETYTILGLNELEREKVDDQKVEVAIFPAGDAKIELLLPVSEDSPVAKFIAKRGQGLHHIALKVPDIAATLEKCKTLNIRLIDRTPRVGAGGSLIAFIHPASTNGVLIELTQRPD